MSASSVQHPPPPPSVRSLRSSTGPSSDFLRLAGDGDAGDGRSMMTSPPEAQLAASGDAANGNANAESAAAGNNRSNGREKTPEDSQEEKENNNNNNNGDAAKDDDDDDSADKMNLSARIDSLQSTLDRVRRETESEITRLRHELMDKNRTLEKLQLQLQEQDNYDDVKRQCQNLKLNLVGDSQTSSPPPPVNLATPLQIPSVPEPPPPPPPPPPTSSESSTKGLEMFLLQRAKALQHANPALKALVDLQAASGNKPWFGDLVSKAAPPSLFPPPPSSSPNALTPPTSAADALTTWRKTLEASFLLPPASSASSPSSFVAPPLSSLSPHGGLNRPPSPPAEHPLLPPRDRSVTPTKTPPTSVVTTTNGDTGGVSPMPKDSNNSSSSPMKPDFKSPFKGDEPLYPLPPFMPMAPGILSSSRIPKSDPLEGHLQDMLRYNMEKYAGQALDTIGSARRVRELLSVHNIGQRLFAKYVLGLSQGTVSELLSKPKCWEKLTEKGRDSYRKMHAWAYDENAILMLKSLIPRKGELSRQPPSSTNRHVFVPHPVTVRNEFPGETDKSKAAAAAAAAAMAVGGPGGDGIMPRYPFPPHLGDGGPPKLPYHPLLPMTNKKPEAKMEAPTLPRPKDDIAADPKDAMWPSDPVKEALQRLGIPGLGGFMGKTAEEMQRAVDAFQSELLRQQQQRAALMAGSIPTSIPTSIPLPLPPPPPMPPVSGSSSHGSVASGHTSPSSQRSASVEAATAEAVSLINREEEANSREENNKSRTSPPTDFKLGSSPSLPPSLPPTALFPPPPPLPPPPVSGIHEEVLKAASASPLQGMASITNSLTNQPLPAPYRPTQRSIKAILPPITQEQFDRYSDINTEELVRTIKEILSQYSISQRLFGENVLGLSQGSVSDLLARPKQYHMLTQKGKEPFIRMKLFLDDDQAVHKLVASQYKIAPEKLMRTGTYGGACTPATAASLSLGLNPLLRPGLKLPPDASPFLRPPFSDASSPTALPAPRFPGDHPLQPNDPFGIQRKLQEQQQRITQSLAAAAAAARGGGVIPPSVGFGLAGPNSIYEIAALTQELNTLQLTTRVRETLAAHNIGQKLFGETILGLSQGSVSELLTKPKPWHMLSIKGREPFIRMHLWLNDPHNVEKLRAVKEERDNLKRKHSQGPGRESNPASPGIELADPYAAVGSPDSAKKQKIQFSDRQKEALKVAFSLDPFPSPSAIDFLGQELGLEPRTIINWFHSHRMRIRQDSDAASAASPDAEEQQRASFDPLHFRLLVNQRLLGLGEDATERSSPDDVQVTTGGGDSTEEDSRQSLDGEGSRQSGRSSRRKPLAPQWVNPSGANEEEVNGGAKEENNAEEEAAKEDGKDAEEAVDTV